MKRNFILILILTISTIYTIYAIPQRYPVSSQLHKRATNFIQCPIAGNPALLNVTLLPDPVVPGQNCVFTITGTLARPIAATSGFIVGFFTSSATFIGTPFQTTTCTLVTCPTSNVAITVDVPVPAALPPSYIIVVLISDDAGLATGCGVTTVSATGPAPGSGSAPAPSTSTAVAGGAPPASPIPAPSASTAVAGGAPPSSPVPAPSSPSSVGGPGNGSGGIEDALKILNLELVSK